jgi:hypothetical protein
VATASRMQLRRHRDGSGRRTDNERRRRRVRRPTTSCRWRQRQGGSHGPAAPTASSEPGDPPYDARGRDSSNLSHATRPDHFRQNRRDIPRSGNGPFLFKRRVPGKKFVIAAADCGFLDRLPWRIPVSMDSSLACIRARDDVPRTGARCRASRQP